MSHPLARRLGAACTFAVAVLAPSAALADPPSPPGTAPPSPSAHVATDDAPLTWPEPDRAAPNRGDRARATAARVSGELASALDQAFPPPEHHPRYVAAIGSGITTEAGWLLGSIGYEPTSWLGLELGGGYGGALGPNVRETIHLDTRRGVSVPIRGVFGVSLSESFFVRGADPSPPNGDVPGVAFFLTPEAGFDQKLAGHLWLRSMFGYSFLLNGASAYDKGCPRSGCDQYVTSGLSVGGPNAWAIGDSARHDSFLPLFAFRVELLWTFDA